MNMQPRTGSSLKNRIALVVGLLFLVGIGLINLFVSHVLHDDMQDMVSKQQLAAANYIARDIDGKIKLRLDSLQRVAVNVPPGIVANPAALQNWLEDRRAIHTLFPTGLMIIPPDGGPTLAETPRLKTRPKSFVDRDWFIGVKTTGQAFVSRPLITRATGEPALVIAVPLFNPQGVLMGVLAGITPLATPGFLDLIIGSRPGQRGEYQLVSPAHRLFALASDTEQAITPLPEKGLDPVLDLAMSGVRGIRMARNANNEEELAAVVEIPLAGWFLLARQPSVDAFAPVSNTLRNALLITFFLAIPLLALLLAALSRLLQPFAHLAEQLHAMAEGERPMRPLSVATTDEVADVAESFNRLQSKLQEQERRLIEMAHHDNLTGLPNRLTIMDRLENELLRFQRHAQGLALLFLDLDGFKPVNDEFGHQVGDLLLCQIGQRLLACVRDVDTVARLGGDEFLIMLSATEAPLEAAERVAHECIKALQMPIRIGDQLVQVGVSIGIATTDSRASDPVTAGQLVSNADVAMYQAKASGRNCYAIYSMNPTQDKPADV
jgi:diguanylate cyclase (GGDEF)-like protein